MQRWDDLPERRLRPCRDKSRARAGRGEEPWASSDELHAAGGWQWSGEVDLPRDGWFCFYFSWRKSRAFPSGPIHRWAKKSPSGVAPEGLKTNERSEPSRRACGGYDGYDGYDFGRKANRGCEGRITGVVHVGSCKKEMNRTDLVQCFLCVGDCAGCQAGEL